MPKVPAHAGIAKFRDNQQLTDAATQTYKQGACVVLDGSQNVTECGADPVLIYGIAGGPAGLHPEGSTKTTITKLGNGQKAWFPFSVSTPTKALYENLPFGLVKDSDGIWTIDVADDINTRVFVHQVDEDTKMGYCSVLQANRQIAP